MDSVIISKKEKALIRKRASVQDVNSGANRLSPDEIKSILYQLEIPHSSVKEACAMKFVQNIMPHDDSSYCRDQRIKKGYFIPVSVSSYDVYKHPDTPLGNYFYHDGVFDMIVEGGTYLFNPKKEHALMVTSKIVALVLFLK